VEAARLLFTSQPSISRLIADLEAAVHLKLFDRRKGRLVLTAEGVAFSQEVERSFAALHRLSDVAVSLRQYRGRELRIGSLPALGLCLLPRAVARFQSRYPDVHVALGIAESVTVREWVVHQQIDLGYVSDSIDSLECDADLICQVPAVVVMQPEHPLASKSIVTATDLAGVSFIHLWSGHAARKRIEDILGNAQVKVISRAETPHAMGICALAAEGVGVGVVNPITLLGSASFNVAARPFEPTVNFRIFELSRQGRRPDALLREFSDIAKKEIKSALLGLNDRIHTLP